MLKKIITIIITVVLTFSMTFTIIACGDKPEVTTDTPDETVPSDSPMGSVAQAETSPIITDQPTTDSTITNPSTTTPITTEPPTTSPATTEPPTSASATTTFTEEPETVPGVPVLLSPKNHMVFSVGEEIDFEWEAGEGGMPSEYRWESQYTYPVEGARFGYWENDNRLYFSDEFAADITSKTMSPVDRNAGRWRVKALNQIGESEWSEWYYFGYGESVPFVNTSLITWQYATYSCFSPVEAGDTVTIEASFWSSLGTGAWYVQLIDPDGNIERSWASCDDIPPLHFPCEDPSGFRTSHQALKTGLYALRVIVVQSPDHRNLRISIRMSPTNLDSLNYDEGKTNPGWHILK